MDAKIELLKDLIELSNLTPQLKLNVIIRALQQTDDIMRARMLSEKIITGHFSGLKEKAIENLIEAFSKLSTEEMTNNSRIIDNDVREDNKTQNLEYELKSLKLKMESMEFNSKKRLEELENRNKELEEQNKKLASKLPLTSNFQLIEVSDESINQLYINYLAKGETVFNDAFILNGIIPKAYYKIK